MLVNKNYKRFITALLITFVMLSILPVNVLAQTRPWGPYEQYIPSETPSVKRHLRGTWICTVINMDWPSRETSKIENDTERIQKTKDELIAILDKSVEMNLNAVFFQVSPEGDAFYKSNLVPWSRYLTGTYGRDPGFDPLAFAIEEAHKRNLEIHAWFNPYRVSMDISNATIESLNTEKSVYKEHPEWIKTSMSRFFVDPGIPAAREWVENRVMEVVDNYDIDGVHFDDYFYYERYEGELKDEDTFNTYNNGQFSNLGDWRRNNTDLLVKEISHKVRSAKSWVKFGISPSGVWANKGDGFPDGLNTNTSYTDYNKCFANTKKWVEEELLDYIAPQIYFTFANSRVSYGEVATWWSRVIRDKKVHLYVGQALFKINEDPDQYFKGEKAVGEVARQLKFNMVKPEVKGSIIFRVNNFNDLNKQEVVDVVKNDLWSTKALVPVMPWKGGKAPVTPTQGKLEELSNSIKLTWNDNDPNTTYYAIYRYNKNENIEITSDTSAPKLIATIRKTNNGKQEFRDMWTSNSDNLVYVVTALDRLHNESSGLMISMNLSENFTDIGKEYSWAVMAIDRLYEKGIVNGVAPGRFSPEQNTKRGDFILMVVRALGLKAAFKDNFADVPKSSYYHDAIGVARALGIAQGSGDSFNPGGNITREDMMVIMARAIEVSGKKLEKAGDEYLTSYKDEKLISSYARGAVASLTKAGLIQGSGNGVDPKRMATRAEIAVILHRVLGNISY